MQMSLGNSIDSDHQRSHPHGRSPGRGELQGALEGGGHEIVETFLDVCRFPKKPLGILHPFEIGNDDSP